MLWLLSIACAGGSDTGVADTTPATDTTCTDLTYANFGQGFMRSWCTGCHGAAVSADNREGAPDTVNFDTIEDVWQHAERIAARATTDPATMPPVGGASAGERTRLAEWLECGAPE